MNHIDFFANGQAIISLQNFGNDISFLTDDFFDNSLERLKSDINMCDDEAQKRTLLKFLEAIEFGKIHSTERISKEMNCETNERSIELACQEIILKNVRAKHTGFWYAALDIRSEIERLKRKIHTFEGFLKLSNSIDVVIETIRNSNSNTEAIHDVCKLGFSPTQSQAILNFPVHHLPYLEKDKVLQNLNECERFISFLIKINI